MSNVNAFGDFSLAELKSFYHEVISLVAKRLKIEIDFKSPQDVVEEIKLNNNSIYNHLEKFINAYDAWYKFSYIDGSLRDLDAENYKKCTIFKDQRNETRNVLLNELNKLP